MSSEEVCRVFHLVNGLRLVWFVILFLKALGVLISAVLLNGGL